MGTPTLELARLLLTEDDDVALAEVLLGKVLEVTGGDRGFVVARDGDQFVPKFEHRIDAEGNDDVARFSRALVRAALTHNRPIHSVNPAEDPQLMHTESVMASAGRAVLVVPLSSGDARFGALYLEHPARGGFTDEARAHVLEVGELAGLALHRAVQRAELLRRSRALEDGLLAQFDFAGIVTRDDAMLAALRTVGQVANAKASVLVRGETGTGKDLLARAIHVNGARWRGPYVALHCAALPSTMLESELFGHVRGAFTGADRDRAGRLASASGGTLFLDEVGELPLEVQAKLLRAVQSGELQRVGSDRIEKVDVRVVAATHRDLSSMVAAGSFRQDLYYRLKVVEIVVPPLRERRLDIALLAQHFLAEHAGAREVRISPRALACLERHDWPGNVRELSHAIERACLLASCSTEIDVHDLPDEISARAEPRAPAPTGPSGAASPSFARYDKDELEEVRERASADLERRFLEGLLARSEGNVSRAARESGIHRGQLQRMLARHRIAGGEPDGAA